MGRMSADPRYNVLSLRASDCEVEEIMQAARGNVSRFLLEAALDKIQTNHDQGLLAKVLPGVRDKLRHHANLMMRGHSIASPTAMQLTMLADDLDSVIGEV